MRYSRGGVVYVVGESLPSMRVCCLAELLVPHCKYRRVVPLPPSPWCSWCPWCPSPRSSRVTCEVWQSRQSPHSGTKLFLSVGEDGTPSIRPLETLHNALSLRQVDTFLEQITSANYKTPTLSPREESPPDSAFDDKQELTDHRLDDIPF